MRYVFLLVCVLVFGFSGELFTSAAASASPGVFSREELSRIAGVEAAANGVPLDLVEAVITVESQWHKDAKNGSSIGLMQITPAMAKAFGFRGPIKELFDPDTNIAYGVRYLAAAYQRADGDICGTVTRYQSGLDARRPNAANRAYCKKMKALLP
jgi:soluble lytic murein transglycosylase-like protein